MNQPQVAASALFSRDAREYDDLRRQLIPCFDDFYGTALRLIEDMAFKDAIRVLDIGAGTGLFSSLILQRYPQAHLCLLDASTGMLEQARQRFAVHDRVEFRLADMVEADLGGPWDLIVSGLAIHHLHDEEKRSLYGRIRAALRAGGLFVNAEQVSGPEPRSDQRYAQIWLEGIRQLGAPEDEIAKALERQSYDRCATVGDQLQWLREAGFSDVDCSFKAWRFAVISGQA